MTAADRFKTPGDKYQIEAYSENENKYYIVLKTADYEQAKSKFQQMAKLACYDRFSGNICLVVSGGLVLADADFRDGKTISAHTDALA